MSQRHTRESSWVRLLREMRFTIDDGVMNVAELSLADLSLLIRVIGDACLSHSPSLDSSASSSEEILSQVENIISQCSDQLGAPVSGDLSVLSLPRRVERILQSLVECRNHAEDILLNGTQPSNLESEISGLIERVAVLSDACHSMRGGSNESLTGEEFVNPVYSNQDRTMVLQSQLSQAKSDCASLEQELNRCNRRISDLDVKRSVDPEQEARLKALFDDYVVKHQNLAFLRYMLRSSIVEQTPPENDPLETRMSDEVLIADEFF